MKLSGKLAGLLWLAAMLLFSTTLAAIRTNTFQSVCGPGASLSPLACARECALDASCAGFTLPPCQLMQNLTCAEDKQTYQKLVSEEPATTAQPLNPCPEPFMYASAVHSCYSFWPTTYTTTAEELSYLCILLHPDAHLIALETMNEHQNIPNIPGNDGSCKYMWTGAYKATPVAFETAGWEWDLGVAGFIPKTISMWWDNGPQPDNSGGDEKHALTDRDISFRFLDVGTRVYSSSWFSSQAMCYVCEYDP